MPRTLAPTLALLLALPLAADDAPKKSYVARVEVQARSVVVVLTDAKGRPVASAPSPDDLEVLEDGAKRAILGIDAVAAEPAPAAAAAPAAPAATPAPRPAAKRTRQVLYVDAACLRAASLPQVVSALEKDLAHLLAIGPLEVVVADPRPRTVLPATSDPAAVTAGLAQLAGTLPGRDRIARLRRQLVNDEESLAFDSAQLKSIDNSWAAGLNAAATAKEEIAIVLASLSRLVTWGTEARSEGTGILYLASDGFDTDLNAFYGDGAGSLGGLVAGAGSALAAAGWIVMPVALGAPAELSSSLTADQNGWGRDSRPVLISSHRLDSLRHVAEETGGTLVGYEGELDPAVRALETRWLLTYRAGAPDGKLHQLAVRSRRKDLVVHAAKTIAAGSATSLSAARALAALRGDPQQPDLPVEARIDGAEAGKKGTMRGTLVVRAKLLSIRDLLPLLGSGRMRVTLAVGVPGSAPFLHHEERELRSLGHAVGWEMHLPIEWPRAAPRAAVVVEELGTGAWGAATLPIPAPAAP